MKHNLTVQLEAKEDDFGGVFYIGKLLAPIEINCTLGVAFFIFVSDQGDEELQIAPMQVNAVSNRHHFKNGRLKIDLETRLDKDKEKYYLCKMRDNMRISCNAGATFMVFVSREGVEQIQIDAQFITGTH